MPAGPVRVRVPGGGVHRLQQHRSPVLVPPGPGLWRLVHGRGRGRLLRAVQGDGHPRGGDDLRMEGRCSVRGERAGSEMRQAVDGR